MRTLYSKVVGTDGSDLAIYAQIAGTSDETKPENLATGSLFLEVDTGLVAMFDESDATWYGGTEVDESDGET